MNIYKPICYGCPGPLMGDCADCEVMRDDDDCEMDADDFADLDFEDEEGGEE